MDTNQLAIIQAGDKFIFPKDGTIFIVDSVEDNLKWGKLICSSLEGGTKGSYRDTINDFIEFLKENNATKITE